MKIQSRKLRCASVFGFVLGFAALSIFALTLNETAKLLPSDGAAGDTFGTGVAMSGDTAVIGAFGHEELGARTGAAYVFDLSSAACTLNEVAKLLASDGADIDRFGASAAVDGVTAVVGASRDDDNGTDSGSAYVFDLTSAGGTLNEVAKLLASDGATRDRFGESVALSGSTALAGADFHDGLGSSSGAAYVFDLTGASGTLNEVAKLVASDTTAGDQFGFDVALDGNVAIIGAIRDDDNGSDSGSAYMFVRSGGVWSQQAKLLSSDGAAEDFFGVTVAVSGSTAVIGAYSDDDQGVNSGSAYVFDLTGASGTVNETAKLLPSDGAAFDNFGFKLAIDGATAVIDARLNDDNGTGSGSAYVFDLTGAAGIVNEVAKLLPSDGAAADGFGAGNAVSGSRAVFGAPGSDPQGNGSGSAYLFSLATDEEGPVTSNTIATPNPVAIDDAVTLSANVDDTNTGGSNIAAADYTIDAGAPVAMAAQDGTFDQVSEDVTAAVPAFSEADVHQLCVSGTDAAGNTGDEDCILLAVYDPDAGFVTGGGWIDSPADACHLTPACEGLTGKANFGFVSRYKKGSQTPTGNTKFLFKLGDLKFDSDSYEWLVVNNHRAQYKGTGTINGGGNYGFKLFAIDAELTSSTDEDLFRIKIWDKDDDDRVVYDNEVGSDEDADPTTEIGGGSIVIHASDS